MPTSPLRIAYVGQPGTDRAVEFASFFAEHFTDVRVLSIADLGSLDLAGADVMVVDGKPLDRDQDRVKLPVRLSLDNFPVPTVLIGGVGGSVGDKPGLKLGWTYGCLCLKEQAICGETWGEHPIFAGPFDVPAADVQTIDTPDNFLLFAAVKNVPSPLPVVEIHEPDPQPSAEEIAELQPAQAAGDTVKVMAWEWQPNPGLVTTSAGFLDSPDCEWILGGVNAKAHDYVAVGRQGRFLQWGFYGAPSALRPVGKALLCNAISYIATFADAPCEARRIAQPRDLLKITLALMPDDQRSQIARQFATPVSVGDTAAEAMEWWEANRGYIRCVGCRHSAESLLPHGGGDITIPLLVS